MACRTYDRKLKCGCMISSDGGGGLIPCFYDEATEKEEKRCKEAWDEWKKTDDYQQHLKECKERNE